MPIVTIIFLASKVFQVEGGDNMNQFKHISLVNPESGSLIKIEAVGEITETHRVCNNDPIEPVCWGIWCNFFL